MLDWNCIGYELARRAKLAEAGEVGVVGAYELQLDHAWARVDEAQEAASLVHRFDTLGTLQPGDEVAVGTQWLRLVDGGRAALREASAELVAHANQGPPEDQPEWLDGAVIEELHPWGRLESWGAGDRGRGAQRGAAPLPA